jgi:predicted acetyltransferase
MCDLATLDPATPDDVAELSDLLELYQFELRTIFGLVRGPDGRFGYARLPRYWSEPDTHFPFLIRIGERVAGFALATRGSPATDDPHVLDVAELYVRTTERRAGVARRAAGLLWDRLPGPWTVRVAQANAAGVAFWDAVVRDYTRGAFTIGAVAGRSHVFRVLSFATAATPEKGD